MGSEQTTSLFFYGTLMSPSVLARVTSRPPSSIVTASPATASTSEISSAYPKSSGAGSTDSKSGTRPTKSLTVHPALLPGHRRHRVRGADYPAVVPVATTLDPFSHAKVAAHTTADAAQAVSGKGGKREQDWGEDDCVRGTYVTGLTPHDLMRLDVFEGDEYTRSTVDVILLPSSTTSTSIPASSTNTQDKMKTQTYIWTSSPSDLDPREWDYDEFVREKMWRWVGDVRPEVNGEFVAVDEEVERRAGEAEEDDSGREVANGSEDPTRGRAFGGGFEERVLEVR